MSRTVWDAPSASSKKEVSFKPETELGYVTSNCMGRAVYQFVEKKLVLYQKQNKDMLHQTVWDAPSASSRKKLVLD